MAFNSTFSDLDLFDINPSGGETNYPPLTQPENLSALEEAWAKEEDPVDSDAVSTLSFDPGENLRMEVLDDGEPTDFTEPPQMETKGFASFGLKAPIMACIEKAGFNEPSPIQYKAIPALLAGRDVIGQAPTGSGKTVAYGLPALQRLHHRGGVEVLVLTPTRELAQQVVEQLQIFSAGQSVGVASVVGGESLRQQVEKVQRGAKVVVATPGRLLDHLSSGRFKNFNPHFVVLDEADEMLDMGFIDDLKEIFNYLPAERQVVLFSATMPDAILKLTKKIQNHPLHIRLTKDSSSHVDIQQKLYVVNPKERTTAIVRLIDAEAPEKAIVFCRTRRETDELCEALAARGVRARAIHGDLNQAARMQAMREIKSGRINVLVGTDVASRGLDISDLSHVFNFHLPENKERYIHRIGRTGRAGNKGTAITLATPGEIRQSFFFREVPVKQFTVEAVPTRDQLEAKAKARMINKLAEVQLTPMAVKVFEEIKDMRDGEALLCQMVAHLLNEYRIQGPNQIGLSLSDINHTLRKPKSVPSRERGAPRYAKSGGRKSEYKGKGRSAYKKGGPKRSGR